MCLIVSKVCALFGKSLGRSGRRTQSNFASGHWIAALGV
jgi:hypothetical protein